MRLTKKMMISIVSGILMLNPVSVFAGSWQKGNTPSNQTYIKVSGAKLRLNPDPQALITNLLLKDEKVYVQHKYENWYGVVLEDGGKGYIYKDQLDEKKLDSYQLLGMEKTSKSKVEVIDWSEANKLMPRGSEAIIEDVYTGKSFSIKRTFGTNHADVETLTAQDTKVMKEIWGGFTWERRPVIVHIKGRRLAASMAGMPHAGKDSAPNLSYTSGLSGGYGYGQNLDAVKGNNMSGVCDLHFRGSKKHKDGTITATPDPKHQAAITVAANYK